jgi:hypothetical protein
MAAALNVAGVAAPFECQSLESLRNELNKLREAGFVFRGQNREYPKVLTSLGRLQILPIRDSLTILEKSYVFAKNIFRFEYSYEWYALLRHHGFPVHFLDVTHNPEVAIFFALDGAEQNLPCVVYAVPPPLCLPLRFISTQNLSPSSAYTVLNARWFTQSGCVLAPLGEEFNMEKIMHWDLLQLQQQGLRTFRYRKHPDDRAGVDSEYLLSQTNEEHTTVKKMKNILLSVVSNPDLFPHDVDPYIREKIQTLS